MKQILEYPESAADEIISLVQAGGAGVRIDVSRKMQTGLARIIKGSKELVLKKNWKRLRKNWRTRNESCINASSKSGREGGFLRRC